MPSALEREESRGAHHRTDFPATDPDWRRNILVGEDGTGLSLRTRGVAAPSGAVQAALDAGHELDYRHLE